MTQKYSDKAFVDRFIGKGETKDEVEDQFIKNQVTAAVDKITPMIRSYSSSPEFQRMLAMELVNRT